MSSAPSSLTAKALGGFAWVFTGGVTQAVIKFGVLALLARLLTPHDFGVVAAVAVVLELTGIFAQIGLAPAIVQKKSLGIFDITTAFSASLCFGLVFGAVVYFSAGSISAFFRMPELEHALRIACLAFPVKSIGVVAEALLQRNLRFRPIAVANLSGYVLGYAALAVTLALQHWGAMALVVGQIAQTCITAGVLLFSAKHPFRLNIKLKTLVSLLQFGAGLTVAQLGSYVAMNVDYLIAGRMLGAEALGAYSRAYYCLSQPTRLIGSLGDQVLFPVLSSVQDDAERIARAYHKSLELVFLVTAPLAALLALLAPQIVGVLLGGQWESVVVPFQILICTLPFRIGNKLQSTILRATGKVYWLASWEWSYALLLSLAAVLGAQQGIAGLATGVAVAMVCNFVTGSVLLYRTASVGWMNTVATVLQFTGLGVALAVIDFAAVRWARENVALSQWSTAAAIFFMHVLQLVLLARFYPQVFGSAQLGLVDLVRRRLERKTRIEAENSGTLPK